MSAKETVCKALTVAASNIARHQVLAGLGVAGAVWAGASWAYIARRSTQTPLFRCTRATAADAAENSAAHFDVIIVGAAIAGTVGAMQLAKQGRHVLVVERSLERPETIIGELLQPGGLEVLERIGLRHCATEVGVRAHGYAACLDGRWTDLPFEDGVEGVSFHHGDFVMRLRSEMRTWNEKNAGATGSITVVEGTVTQLLYGPKGSNTADRITGIAYTRKGADVKAPAERALAPLTVLCDGGGSNFKSRPPVHSRFFGFVLRDISLEFEERGNVILGRHGIILAYRLDAHEVRFLIDYGKGGAPPSQAEVQRWLREDIRPDIPERYRAAYDLAIQGEVRSMPHHHFTPLFPSARGVVGIGDHGNQRHPLTGAGMTCAMRDAVGLAEALAPIADLNDAARVHSAVQRFLCQRPRHSSVMNVLSWALYGVFTGPMSIRRACMAYFREGGDAVRVPLRFLSGLDSSMERLIYHYMLTVIAGAKTVMAGEKGQRSLVTFATFFINPVRILTTLHLAAYAAVLMTSVGSVEFGNPWRLIDRTVWAPTLKVALSQ